MAAAYATLQANLDHTVRQVARDFGVNPATIPAVRGWRRPTTREIRDPALPLVIITSSGWVESPEVNADGSVNATYDLVVNPIVRGADFEATADLISIYGAGVRACLEQRRSLGVGWVSDLVVVGETYGDEEQETARVLAEALVIAHVRVCSIHDRNDRPGPDGWEMPETVATTDVTLDPLEEA